MVGRIANANGMKTNAYDQWYHDKFPHSAKQANTFKHNAQAVKWLKELVGKIC